MSVAVVTDPLAPAVAGSVSLLFKYPSVLELYDGLRELQSRMHNDMSGIFLLLAI